MRSSTLIRDVRAREGVGVRELARRAKVTPAAVTQWENSELRGTIREATLQKALHALGTSLQREIAPTEPHQLSRREERVALELHRAVAVKLIEHPSLVIAQALDNIPSLQNRVRGDSVQRVVDHWQHLLERNRLGALIEVMLATDSYAISMRQTSPFLGVLTQDERVAAIDRASL